MALGDTTIRSRTASTRGLDFLVIFATSVTTLILLWPLARIGLMGDDLVSLALNGSYLYELGLPQATKERLIESTFSGTHFVPVAGILQTIYTSLAYAIGAAMSSAAHAWAVMRVVLSIVGLLVTSISMAAIFSGRSRTPTGLLKLTGMLYPPLAFSFVTLAQIQAPRSQDPLLSYPFAGWGTVILGMAYLGLLAQAFRSTQRDWRWFAIAGIVACAGVLTYEAFVAFLVAAVVPIVGVARHKLRALLWVAGISLFCGGILLLGSSIRLDQEVTYSGSSIGETALILPVTANALRSALPVTNASQLGGNVSTVLTLGTGSFIFLMGASALALLSVYQIRRSRSLALDLFGPRLALTTAGYLAVAGATMTLIFSSTAKYQMEIGLELGKTYLNSLTLLLLSATLLTFALGRATLGMSVVLSGVVWTAVIIFGLFQWTINLNIVDQVARESEWTFTMFALIDEDSTEQERCEVLATLQSDARPALYKTIVRQSLETQMQERFQVPYCQSDLWATSDRVDLAEITEYP